MKRRNPFIIVHNQPTLRRYFLGNNEVEEIKYETEGTDLITIEEAETFKGKIAIKKLSPVQLFGTRKPLLYPIPKGTFQPYLQNQLSQLGFSKLALKSIRKKKSPENLTTKLTKYVQVINLLENGYENYKEIGDRFRLKRQEVRNIADRLKSGKKGLPTRNKKPKKLTEKHLNFIDKYVQNPANVAKTLFQIKEALIKNFNLNSDFVSTSNISRALWHLKFTYKKLYPIHQDKNSPRVKGLRCLAVSYLLKAMESNFKIIYIDEVGFNMNMTKNYGYSKTNHQAKIITPAKSENYSVIAALTTEGYIGFQIFKGGVKSEDFCCFILNLVKKLGLQDSCENFCFFMDNAAIHKSHIFKEKILSRFAVIYNAPYSPELNPIEESFAKWKHLVRKIKKNNAQVLLQSIIKTAPLISSFNAISYIRHSLSFYEASFNKEDI